MRLWRQFGLLFVAAVALGVAIYAVHPVEVQAGPDPCECLSLIYCEPSNQCPPGWQLQLQEVGRGGACEWCYTRNLGCVSVCLP